MHTICLIGTTFLLPTLAETEEGFDVEVEPVQQVPAAASVLAAALARHVMAGNPRMGRTTPANRKKRPVAVAAAGLRSWSAFARAAKCWAIHAGTCGMKLTPSEVDKHGQFRWQPAGHGTLQRVIGAAWRRG